ncbi:MAG: ribosomal protein S18-alanine N-acetyltransferase [Acutalibacteraceae bacterium]|nr:ribosomal protein S18-alanine N-acetyltransferase [Clostridia bacterium]MEE3402791.1 ribosomal protein S18-alanine N-acetyltransferase [Acutalibacteraceae bacterium]HCA53914.1 ribosomal-protein-alanine N-acetyltransferase [Oscillospiraceae bacterium]
MMNMTIARMEEQHIEAVADLEAMCFSTPWTEENLRSSLANKTDYFFVALDEEEDVIGYIGVSVVADSCFINNIAVYPACRRQGVGTALLKIAIMTADVNSTEFISLEVRESNAAAIALYEALGFEEMGRRKNFYRRPQEDALIMTKLLTKKEK